MAAHTKIDLYQMQSLPLDAKIRMTARRIDAFIDRNDAYLSISGGKDSRVLDDIERRFVRAKLPRVFIDTGLEHRSVRACGKKHRMKSKTILGADGATKMRQITVGIHGKGGEAGISAGIAARI